MKGIRQAAVAAALSVGLVSVAEAHVFVSFGIGAPVMPMAPMVAAVPVASVPVYAPPPAPIYYAHSRSWYGHYGYG